MEAYDYIQTIAKSPPKESATFYLISPYRVFHNRKLYILINVINIGDRIKTNIEKALCAEHATTMLLEMTFAMQQLEESMERVAKSLEPIIPKKDCTLIYNAVVDLKMDRIQISDIIFKQSEKLDKFLKES